MRFLAKGILILAGLVVLATSAGCIQSGNKEAKGNAAVTGSWTGNAKDFTYTTFAGSSGKASDFAGKPLVVNFWAAW
jgi:cytochrome oxidase Cu insertion factor (SCO1/SenC/PrrC family)